jgi:hypothetical protein
VTYRTTASYPDIDPAPAVAALRGCLGTVAARDGAVPDWSTLRITGPTEVVDPCGRVSYEWVASVEDRNEAARAV